MQSFLMQEWIALSQKQGWRQLTPFHCEGKYLYDSHHRLLNLGGNDYLGLAQDPCLQEEFLQQNNNWQFSASSSRLLTGNSPVYTRIEAELATLFHKEAALLFNSGYHANIGILAAITTKRDLILADKLVHASLIDGIRLSPANCIRYRHNDYAQLSEILEKRHRQHEKIILLSESLFSMDGDRCDLSTLVHLKEKYDNVFLYIDEAHAFGCYGEQGLGLCEEHHLLSSVDFLVGTFGKALGSCGAFVVCSGFMKNWLTNHVRSLIFTTGLPPVNLEWTLFLLKKLPQMQHRREKLQHLCQFLDSRLKDRHDLPSPLSYIIPIRIGAADKTMEKVQELRNSGFYVSGIRPPSVAPQSSRLRISLNALIEEADLLPLIQWLNAL